MSRSSSCGLSGGPADCTQSGEAAGGGICKDRPRKSGRRGGSGEAADSGGRKAVAVEEEEGVVGTAWSSLLVRRACLRKVGEGCSEVGAVIGGSDKERDFAGVTVDRVSILISLSSSPR